MPTKIFAKEDKELKDKEKKDTEKLLIDKERIRLLLNDMVFVPVIKGEAINIDSVCLEVNKLFLNILLDRKDFLDSKRPDIEGINEDMAPLRSVYADTIKELIKYIMYLEKYIIVQAVEG